MKRALRIVLALALAVLLTACAAVSMPNPAGSYTSKRDVAEFLHVYGQLPQNFITKAEAQALGWPGGDLSKYAPGKSIGGDRFGNYEGALPEKRGRTWYECDIDFDGKYRNEKRILYSSDGLIYYTDDHYETFEDITER